MAKTPIIQDLMLNIKDIVSIIQDIAAKILYHGAMARHGLKKFNKI